MQNIAQINKKECTGCGLCSVVCPKSCIKMASDAEGFLVPSVDEALCVDCGICLKKCPVTEASDGLFLPERQEYFCGAVSDKEKLKKSSSGGVFLELAEHFLNNKGAVCGCVYDENAIATHRIYTKGDSIEDMCGSKYVQSHSSQCFEEIKRLASEERPVLFTGTACQIAALKGFLGKEYPSLYTVEILCHGVPSPGFFKKYVEYLEKKLHGKVLSVQFRNKEKKGWGSEHRTCVVYRDKHGDLKKYRPLLPAYFSAFFYGLNLRESCYNCKFAKQQRVADLTIGDFRGYWSKFGKTFNEGISVIGVNSGKGKELVLKTEPRFSYLTELEQNEAIRSNDNFEHPVKRPKERDRVYENINKGYRGFWKKAYLTKTYRKKTVASFYGALVPQKIRMLRHKLLK